VNELLSFAVTCLVIELTPGPNMAYLAVLSASEGRRAGLAATAGVALGLLLLSLAAALGLSAIITQSPTAYAVLRWSGVAFLLYLAWEAYSAAGETSPAHFGDHENLARYFQRGLVNNLLNPKAALFYVAILPSFVDASRPVIAQTAGLSLVSVVIATFVHAVIVALAGAAQPWLQEGSRARAMRRVMAVLLAGIALWLAAVTRI
jgi:threonine/homoserine/homoserine lactone efflux protein